MDSLGGDPATITKGKAILSETTANVTTAMGVNDLNSTVKSSVKSTVGSAAIISSFADLKVFQLAFPVFRLFFTVSAHFFYG